MNAQPRRESIEPPARAAAGSLPERIGGRPHSGEILRESQGLQVARGEDLRVPTGAHQRARLLPDTPVTVRRDQSNMMLVSRRWRMSACCREMHYCGSRFNGLLARNFKAERSAHRPELLKSGIRIVREVWARRGLLTSVGAEIPAEVDSGIAAHAEHHV